VSAAKAKAALDPDKVQKLLDAWDELQAKQDAIVDEIRRMLAGGRSIGQLVKYSEDAFGIIWSSVYPGQYVWTYARDRVHMKRLILQLGDEELEARFRRYMQNTDPYFVKARHSFGAFVSSVNQHAAPSTAAALELEGDNDRPVGCTHLPACKDDVEHTRWRAREMRGSHSGPKGEVL
jgi:hypothetical protein